MKICWKKNLLKLIECGIKPKTPRIGGQSSRILMLTLKKMSALRTIFRVILTYSSQLIALRKSYYKFDYFNLDSRGRSLKIDST